MALFAGGGVLLFGGTIREALGGAFWGGITMHLIDRAPSSATSAVFFFSLMALFVVDIPDRIAMGAFLGLFAGMIVVIAHWVIRVKRNEAKKKQNIS